MIRVMKMEDYDQVYALWSRIHGFGLRSVDDSREGIRRFLERNPTTSVVAEEDGRIVGAILCGAVSIMSAWTRDTGCEASGRLWWWPPWRP